MNNGIIETKNYIKPKMPKKKKIAIIIAVSSATLCLCAVAFWFLHPHMYKEWQVTISPTCIENGEGIFRCFCGETETRALAPDLINGHAKIIDQGYAATKTQDGLTDGSHCGICNAITEEQTVIYALGSQGLAYSIMSGTTCEIIGIGTCSDTEILIPKYIDGYQVAGIGNNAFVGIESITSIIVPEGVTSIGHRAFESCINIISITLPESITHIGNASFCGCISLASITIPEGLTSIGSDAFMNCYCLTDITIPEGITTIGSYAFSCCNGLKSISLPKSLAYIKMEAFQSCVDITSIIYSGTVSEWNAISKEQDWDWNTGEYTVYCVDGTITKDGTVTYN